MANAAAPKPEPLKYQTQRAIVLQSADQDVIRILKEMQADVRRMLKEVASRPAGIGRDIREAQLRLVQRNLQGELAKAWRRVGDVTEARRVEAAIRAAQYQLDANKFQLTAGGVPDGGIIAQNIYDSEVANAASGLDRMIARTSGASYVPLSERVYNSSVAIGSKVDKLVNSALTRGLSAREFAAEVMQFINPLTPGGVSYAALRLARTEINNSAHAMSVHAVRETPWVEKMEWRLSGSHGRPDVCDQYAKGGPNNDGRYSKGAVPTKPHPQCLCFVIPVLDDEEEFNTKLLRGDYNQYLERYRNLQPGQVVTTSYGGFAPPPKKAVAPPKPTKVAKPPKPAAKPPSLQAPPAPGVTAAAGDLRTQQIDFAKALLNSGKRQGEALVELAEKFGIPQNKALFIVLDAQKSISGASAVAKAVAPIAKKAGTVASGAARVVPRADNTLEALRRKVNIPGDNGARILREMERQSRLVPETMGRLRSVDYATAAEDARWGASPGSLGYYINKPGENRIFLRQTIFEDKYRSVTFPKEIRTGWCSRAGEGVPGDQAVFAHEFGHHVAEAVTRLGDLGRREFFQGIADDLGVPRPASGVDSELRRWMQGNKSVLKSKVSTYGSSDQHELLAEIWHEYSTNPNARPWIKKAGARMKRVAEGGTAA